jgi:hypothetical protein
MPEEGMPVLVEVLTFWQFELCACEAGENNTPTATMSVAMRDLKFIRELLEIDREDRAGIIAVSPGKRFS